MTMDYSILLTAILLAFCEFQHVAYSLYVTDIRVPEIVDFRENVTLSCSYDMSGHTLNSVKWYKDEKEFFRYSPMQQGPFLKFPVDGVEALYERHYCDTTTCRIDLGQLKKNSSGVYRCEVSGDAPHFKLTTKAANMTVAALPQHDPLINGFNPTYSLDEFVVANCSSDYSSPPATLTWYINNEMAPPEILQIQQETRVFAHGFDLRLRSLEIRFYLDSHRFFNSKGNLHLKCVADINQIEPLRREKILTASLIHFDNLNNQMLINSGKSHKLCSIVLNTGYLMLFLINFNLLLFVSR